MKPSRLQLSRRKGFRMQEASLALNGLPAVKVTRPGKWGNPFRIGGWFMVGDPSNRSVFRMSWCQASNAEIAGRTPGKFTLIEDNATAVQFFRRLCAQSYHSKENLAELRGRNLACFCKLGEPCHADVLLEIANSPASSDQ